MCVLSTYYHIIFLKNQQHHGGEHHEKPLDYYLQHIPSYMQIHILFFYYGQKGAQKTMGRRTGGD